jgi:chromosome segregation ATPase
LFDEADSAKKQLKSQIEALEDLIYATDREDIIAEIDAKIEEFKEELTTADSTIAAAQAAFNTIATQTLTLA